MASTGDYNDQPDQPGLEAIPQYDTGLQMAPPNDQNYPIPAQLEQESKGIPQEAVVASAELGPPPPRGKNVKRIILITIGCILIVIGVVVGAVVGTQKSRSSTPAPTTAPSDSAPGNGTVGLSPAEMTGSPTSVAPGLAPTAVSWGYPHLEIFALTNNNSYSIYRKYRNANATSENDFIPAGTGMELVGGSINATEAPAIAVNHRIEGQSNQTEIYMNGMGTGYHKYHAADELWILSLDQWRNFDQRFSAVGAPTQVEYNASVEAMKVFYLSNSDAGYGAYYFEWLGTWSNAIQIQGPALQLMTPAVVAWNRNNTRVDIFVVSKKDSHLLHASWNVEISGWTAYEDLKGFVTTSPVAVSREPGIIDVFARSGDARLWHLSYDHGNNNWTDWTRLGDTEIQGKPDAISISSDSLDVFAWGQDGSMLHKSYNSTTESWTPKDGFDVLVDGILSGPPNAVSDGPGSIHVFAYNKDNQLIRKTLSQSAQGSDAVTLANVPYLSIDT